MARVAASRELESSREDVWGFVSEPHHFGDWWPTVAAVEPDRRGFAAGARWGVHAHCKATRFRRSRYSGVLLVRGVDRPNLFAWTLTGDRIDAELRLTATAKDRTLAEVIVEASWLLAPPRRPAGRAADRV